MEDTFFPLTSELVEDPVFMGLTVIEKLFLMCLISDANLYKNGWYKADNYYAGVLNVSLEKIRKSRPKFKKLGLIDYESGGLKGNRKFATQYKSVKFSEPVTPFARIMRFNFMRHCSDIGNKNAGRDYRAVTHADVLFVTLSQYKNRFCKDDKFFVPKAFYISQKLSAIKIKEAVEWLNKWAYQDEGEKVLTTHHKVLFTAFYTWSISDKHVYELENSIQTKCNKLLKESVGKNLGYLSIMIKKMRLDGDSKTKIMRELGLTKKIYDEVSAKLCNDDF